MIEKVTLGATGRFSDLRSSIKRVINEWIKDHTVKYLINSHPINLALDVGTTVDLDNTPSNSALRSFDSPLIRSSLSNDLGISSFKIAHEKLP